MNLRGIAIIVLVIFIIQAFIGVWCCNNTNLLLTHHLEREIQLPKWIFILGAEFTQVVGLPYGLITEVWCRVIGVK